MNIPSLCKLMKIRELFFSSHGIRAGKRVGILGLGLAMSSILATHLIALFLFGLINSIAKQLEAFIDVGSPSLPVNFFGDLVFDWRAHHWDCQQLIYSSEEEPLATTIHAPPRTRTFHGLVPHAPTREGVWPISWSSHFTCKLVMRRSFLLSF